MTRRNCARCGEPVDPGDVLIIAALPGQRVFYHPGRSAGCIRAVEAAAIALLSLVQQRLTVYHEARAAGMPEQLIAERRGALDSVELLELPAAPFAERRGEGVTERQAARLMLEALPGFTSDERP